MLLCFADVLLPRHAVMPGRLDMGHGHLAGCRSPGNREIAIRDQLLVDGSGLAVSCVDNDCELGNILRGMATSTTDGRARSLKNPVPSRMFHLSESTDQSGRRISLVESTDQTEFRSAKPAAEPPQVRF
jgi:hypothetical protein